MVRPGNEVALSPAQLMVNMTGLRGATALGHVPSGRQRWDHRMRAFAFIEVPEACDWCQGAGELPADWVWTLGKGTCFTALLPQVSDGLHPLAFNGKQSCRYLPGTHW